MRALRAGPLVATVISVALLAGGAGAQSGQDAATAETLFRDAKALMEQGNFKDACQKLEASQRLDPGTGTLLNLADCNAKLGKTASAWAQFLEAATLAKRAGTQDRADVATARAKALEPRLVRVRLIVTDQTKVSGLEVRRDGAVVDPATWGSPTPVDPGSHTFVASAPNRRDWTRKVDANGEGQTVDVAVPPLEPAPVTLAPPSASAAAPPPPAVSSAPPPPPPPPPSITNQQIAGLAVAGAGVVSIGVGSVFGLMANSKWKDANCPNKLCATPSDQDKAHTAKTDATVSTATFIVGGALVAAGAVLFFTGKPSEPATTGLSLAPTVGRTGAGLSFQGGF